MKYELQNRRFIRPMKIANLLDTERMLYGALDYRSQEKL